MLPFPTTLCPSVTLTLSIFIYALQTWTCTDATRQTYMPEILNRSTNKQALPFKLPESNIFFKLSWEFATSECASCDYRAQSQLNLHPSPKPNWVFWVLHKDLTLTVACYVHMHLNFILEISYRVPVGQWLERRIVWKHILRFGAHASRQKKTAFTIHPVTSFCYYKNAV